MAITGAPSHAVADTAVTRGRRRLARQLRADAMHASALAGSGHSASSVSAAELMAVLLDGHLRLGPSDPQDRRCDHMIFSRGRAQPLYHAMLKAAGATGDEAPADVVTSSTGLGLPIGIGLALAGGHLDQMPCRVWVLCGDSEMTETPTWDAFQYGGRATLGNLTVVVDVNRLGHAGEVMLTRDLRRARAFGWHADVIDGHDVDAIDRAYREAATDTVRPAVIFARTRMSRAGKTVSAFQSPHHPDWRK